MPTADVMNLLRRAYEEARRAEDVAELSEFLRYYVGLRRDVLTGRRQNTRPLGIRYRWRQWQYEKYQRRVQERDWQH